MATELINRRPPYPDEVSRGAEIVFIRKDKQGNVYRILACKCYESWEQWGEIREVLADNVPDVESWRRNFDDNEEEEV